MRDDPYWLDRQMEFEHVVRVEPDGTINGHPTRDWPHTPYAPESVVETRYDGSIMKPHEDRWTESIRSQGWEPERGWTGQYGYSGPFMHPSEFIGGNLADHIASTPGLWVAVTVNCLRGGPDPDEIVTCVYCGTEIELQETDLWEDPKAGGPSSDAARHCPESADHLHAGEFDNEEDEEPDGWALLHIDDGPESDSYVVKRDGGEISRKSIEHLTRMDLEAARRLRESGPAWRHGVIVRVTDLAVMGDDGAIPDPRDYMVTLDPRPVASQALHIAGLPKVNLAEARREVLNRWIAGRFSLGRIVRVSDMTEVRDETTPPATPEERDARITALEAEQTAAMAAGLIDAWEATGKADELDGLREARGFAPGGEN